MDGGSTDGSVDIIKSFERDLSFWISAPDAGQAAAINQGVKESSGEIICWLNSDDYFLPGSLLKVSQRLESKDPALLFGNCIHVDERRNTAYGSDVECGWRNIRLSICDFIIQPSAFWTRSAWEKVGALNETLHYTMDWDWFQRALSNEVRFLPSNDYFSVYRIHPGHKTSTGGLKRQVEIEDFIKRWNTPECYDAVMRYWRERDRIQVVSGLLVRMRLRNRRSNILKTLFPNIFRHVSLAEAEAYCQMVD